MEPTRDEGHGHGQDDFHDNLIPDSWQRDSQKNVRRGGYGQAPLADDLHPGDDRHDDAHPDDHHHHDEDYDEEDDEEEDITGPGKLPFRSRRYDLVPDDSELVDPLASPPAATTSEAYRFNRDSLLRPASDRRDFGHAQASPFSPDTERLIPQHGPQSKLWTPVWLKRRSLIIFAVFFLMLLLATALVYQLSLRTNGLGVASEATHYFWRLVPTAVLVMTAAYWRQIDYRIRILMPWSEMAKFPATPEKSVFVDYITPSLPLVFIRAVKNRHWPVVLSSLCYIFLIITMLFSTGLFMLEDAPVTEDRKDIKIKSEFKLAASSDHKAWSIGPGAAQLYNAINFQGLYYTPGTSEDAIISALDIPQTSGGNTNYTVKVDGIDFNLDCDKLPLTNATQKSIPFKSMLAQSFVTDIKTGDCEIKGVLLASGPDHYQYNDKNATQNYQAQFQVYPCNTDWDFSMAEAKPADDKAAKVFDASADQRVFLSVTDMQISPYDKSLNAPTYMYINKITALLCKPSYEMKTMTASQPNTVNGAAVVSREGRADTTKRIDGFPNGALALAVQSSAASLFLGTGGKDFVLSEMVPTFFQFMTQKTQKDTIGAFTDADLLMSSAKTVFKGMAAQTMHLVARQPGEKEATGTIEYAGKKLVAYLVSVAFMCTFLGLSVIIAIALIFFAPRAITPHRPGSIASMATIMATSPLLRQVMSGTGKASPLGLRQKLSEFRYKTAVTSTPSTFRIEAVRQMETEAIRPDRKSSTSSWWQPTASQWWFLALAVVIPLAMIGALEAIQRISDSNQGFLSVGRSGLTIFTTFVPAAVVLVLASMFSRFATMASVFAPFVALKKGHASADRTVHFNIMGRSLPLAFWRSVKAWHFAVAIFLAANFIAAFLSIVVSSLYSVVEFDRPEDMTIRRMDNFQLANAKLAMQDNHAASMDSLIRYTGMNYSQWTWEGLAFPRFEQNEYPAGKSLGDAPLVAQVQAVRPGLTCSAIPATDKMITQVEAKQDPASYVKLPYQNDYWTPVPGHITVGFNTTMNFSDYCETPPTKNVSQASWMQYFSIPNDTSSAFIGKGSVLLWNEAEIYGDGAVNTHSSSHANVNFDVADHGCPSFAVTLGEIRVEQAGHDGDASSWKFKYDLATVVCYQTFEEVSAQVTWQLPDFVLDPKRPPVVDESSAHKLKSSTGSERFQIPVNAWLEGLTDPVYNRTLPSPNNGPPSNNDLDELIYALVFGKGHATLSDILGEDNACHLGDVVTKVYQDYMAQAVSLNMRSTDDIGKRANGITGTLHIPGRRRLVQNEPAKIAMQVLLGLLVLCLAVARPLLRVGKVLPHNPCTIAGMATLLADSNLATDKVIPAGSEWLDDEGLQSSRLFAGWTFALRWWDGAEKTPESRRYGVGTENEFA